MIDGNNRNANHFGAPLNYPQHRYEEMAEGDKHFREVAEVYDRTTELYEASEDLVARFKAVMRGDQPGEAWELIEEHRAVLDELNQLFPRGLLLSNDANEFIQRIHRR